MKIRTGIAGLALVVVFLLVGLTRELSALPFCPEICMEVLGCAYGEQLCGMVLCEDGQWGTCWWTP